MPLPGQIVGKDPDSELVYPFDWDRWLATGAQISTSTWIIATGDDETDDGDLTADNTSIITGGRQTQARLIGGTTGRTYKVTNRIVTDESPAQTEDMSLFIRIREQ